MAADDNRHMTTPASPDGALPLPLPLPHWGLMRASGADAATFLQGQLTNDVAHMLPSQARLAGFCSPKGRLQASFVVCRLGPDDFLLACSASVLPTTVKRLSMFVLRAKCRLTDATHEFALRGMIGPSALALIGNTPIWGVQETDGGRLVRLPDVDGVARYWMISGASVAPEHAVSERSPGFDAWRELEVRSGVPSIEAATVDRFVPQMLNYELIGGVDFAKGCYPGQEVVARSQYRGTLKRRMFLFECDAQAAAGQEVFHSADLEQPAGLVVDAAPAAGGTRWVVLAEVKLAALADGSLHLGTSEGVVLRRIALPYVVPYESTATSPSA